MLYYNCLRYVIKIIAIGFIFEGIRFLYIDPFKPEVVSGVKYEETGN